MSSTERIKGKVAIVGVGGLGAAMARGLLGGALDPAQLVLCDVDESRVRSAVSEPGWSFAPDALDAVRGAGTVLIAVKPADVSTVLDRMGPGVAESATVISVAAGITLKRLRDWLGANGQLVRAMPNVNVAVGASVTGLVLEPGAPATALDAADRLFRGVGTTVHLADEKLLDPCTALGASGPAWTALVIEGLIDGGVKAGLPRAVSTQLALAMVEGTARHLAAGHLHPGQLKDMVTSPGGTTAAGQLVLEQAGVRGALMAAVDAATLRARDLQHKT